jgi:RecB family exonuclease/superfamily I DNA/RNA helicase
MSKRAPSSKLDHRLFTGSFYPELEAALAREIGECKKQHGPFAPVHILVPSSLLRVYLPRRLAENFGGHANLRVQTLTDLVRSLSPPDTVPLPAFADELIIADVIEKHVQPESYFGPVRQGAGFRSALLAAFRDLKQADLSPSDLHEAGRSLNRTKFDQLADLYSAYESALKATGFSDEDELLQQAIKALRTQDSGLRTSRYPLSTRLLIYGFYDFNHLQRELIASLVARTPATVFVPYHESPAFQYAKPTLEWFEHLLGVENEPFADAREEVPRTLEQLRSGLFQGREIKPNIEPEPFQVAILSAPGEARESKEILREAVRFSEQTKRALFHTAVIARRAEDYAKPLRDSAASRGYAVHLHAGRALLNEPVAQAVLLLPRIVAEDFARRLVLEFLSLAPIQISKVLPEDLRPGFLPSTWGQISAEASIVAGVEAWQQRLDRWVKRELAAQNRTETAGEPASQRSEQRLLAGRALEAFTRSFVAALSRIPAGDAKWSACTAAIESVARKFLEPSDELESALGCVRHLCALEAIRAKVPLTTFIEFAQKALVERKFTESKFEDGGLFVGGLESCRGASWPMVVVPGLVESTFPRVVREDPILLDEERKVINAVVEASVPGRTEVGKPKPQPPGTAAARTTLGRLSLKQAGHDEERLLFQLAVESARERLVLTYPRLDPFRGNEHVPSIFLLHCIEALRGGTANFASLERDPLHRVVPLQEITTEAEPLDAQEFDLTKVHRALGQGVRALGSYLDAVSPWIVRGLRCERRRWGTPAFTEFDGVFESEQARTAIAAWADGRVWSATAFERFARSPFAFFLTDVLGVEEFEDPEEAEGALAKHFGALWHDILRDVVEQVIANRSWAVPNESALVEKHLAEFERTGVTGYPLVWEVCREKLSADVAAWLRNEAEDASFFPLHLEHPLPPTEVLGVTLRGRVDRVDASRNGEWRVYDYKTGRRVVKAETFDKGRALQIPLYMLALEKSNAPVQVVGGYYFYVTRAGGLKRSGWPREALVKAEPALRALVQEIVESIRGGRFYLTDQTRDVAGVTMPEAALTKLMEIKQTDPRWAKLAALLAEEAGPDE